jgi:hypothetical protein
MGRMIAGWIPRHKALIAAVAGSLVVGLAHLGQLLEPPWDQIVTAVAITLAALSGGPMPRLPAPIERGRAARERGNPFPPAGY